MYKTGVYFGRFCPPHRGHLYQIVEASTRCEKLVVVISDNRPQTEKSCRDAGLPVITYPVSYTHLDVYKRQLYRSCRPT